MVLFLPFGQIGKSSLSGNSAEIKASTKHPIKMSSNNGGLDKSAGSKDGLSKPDKSNSFVCSVQNYSKYMHSK